MVNLKKKKREKSDVCQRVRLSVANTLTVSISWRLDCEGHPEMLHHGNIRRAVHLDTSFMNWISFDGQRAPDM